MESVKFFFLLLENTMFFLQRIHILLYCCCWIGFIRSDIETILNVAIMPITVWIVYADCWWFFMYIFNMNNQVQIWVLLLHRSIV